MNVSEVSDLSYLSYLSDLSGNSTQPNPSDSTRRIRQIRHQTGHQTGEVANTPACLLRRLAGQRTISGSRDRLSVDCSLTSWTRVDIRRPLDPESDVLAPGIPGLDPHKEPA